MKRDDTLWKGILENLFDDFLRFLFKDADNLFDMRKGFQFLDKELEQISSSADDMQSPKFVDKLVKVFTKTGAEEWFLVHIEIQGYDDTDFGKRMFTYFYRILDKYGKPVTAIAVFTDTNKKFKPQVYEYDYLGTKITFQFNTYKIIEQEEKVIEKSKTPFAIVILTVLLALKSGKLGDAELFKLKFSLAKKLLDRKFSKPKIRGLMNFLKFYVHFEDPKYNYNFDEAIEVISKNKTTMGIEEMILERARKEGLQKGLEEGLEKGLEKGIEKGLEKGRLKGRKEGLEKGMETKSSEVVKNLIERMNLPDSQVAEIAGVSVEFVKRIRRNLEK